MTSLHPALIRTLGLMLPIALSGCLWLWRRPDKNEQAGILLACVWNIPSLLLINILAMRLGWWQFHIQGGQLAGIPVDLYLGWILLWGMMAPLAFSKLRLVFLVPLAFAVDLLWMPCCFPVVELGNRWIIGEIAALTICFLPSQLLMRWTRQKIHLRARVFLQFLCFTSLVMYVLPCIIFEVVGGNWNALTSRPVWMTSLFLQGIFLAAVPGLSAVQEFVERGSGTPIPHDPPLRLVTSGVYAYLANPMQFSMCLVLILWGLLLKSYWVVGGGIMGVIYSAGLAKWDEEQDLKAKYQSPWIKYREHVRPWKIRWKAYISPIQPQATIYIAEQCDACNQLKNWLQRHKPDGLQIIPAERHPARDLNRITYITGDGVTEEQGIAALARALEHIHIGWAFVGWVLRLPGLWHLVQLITDVSGGGPRLVPRSFSQNIIVNDHTK